MPQRPGELIRLLHPRAHRPAAHQDDNIPALIRPSFTARSRVGSVKKNPRRPGRCDKRRRIHHARIDRVLLITIPAGAKLPRGKRHRARQPPPRRCVGRHESHHADQLRRAPPASPRNFARRSELPTDPATSPSVTHHRQTPRYRAAPLAANAASPLAPRRREKPESSDARPAHSAAHPPSAASCD